MGHLIFLNTAWMRDYNGLRNDKMTGGGKHIDKEGWGGEMFNFREWNGKYYGYAETKGNLKLKRIDPNNEKDYIDNVTIVWTAKRPSGGTYIIGWYKYARLYSSNQKAPSASNRKYYGEQMPYKTVGLKRNCKLLPLDKRILKVPRGGKGSFGEKNNWYADNNPNSVQTVKNYIFKGITPKPTSRQNKKGVPRQIDPLTRQRIETKAVKMTIKHYQKEGYIVSSVEKDNVGWDLTATHNEIEIRIEVKGLSGNKITVELTPNEFSQMNKHKNIYRLCVVTETLSKPRLNIFSYSDDIEKWIDEQDNILIIEKIISARATAD
jgi:hypothetical protein